MRNHWLILLFVAIFIFSCEDNTENILDSDALVTIQEIDMTDFYVRTDTSDPLGKPSNSKGNSQKCFT